MLMNIQWLAMNIDELMLHVYASQSDTENYKQHPTINSPNKVASNSLAFI